MDKTLVEIIMAHLLEEIHAHGETEFKRNQLAARFNCVPSQISYILETKFKPSEHYIVEIQRGSGGYIRIKQALIWAQEMQTETPQELIERAFRSCVITKRETILMLTALEHMKEEQEVIKFMEKFLKIIRGTEK